MISYWRKFVLCSMRGAQVSFGQLTVTNLSRMDGSGLSAQLAVDSAPNQKSQRRGWMSEYPCKELVPRLIVANAESNEASLINAEFR